MFRKLFVVCLIILALNSGECLRIRAAPYFMPLENNPPDVQDAIKSSGIKQFVLAFVLAPISGGCVPTWDGNNKQKVSEDTKVLKIVETIRSNGGDVSISFGGYTGIELGNPNGCSNVEQLAEAYQSVIDKYDLTNIDLDIEGDELGDDVSEHKRFKAIKILKEKAKSKGKQLFVSLTIPATSVGISDLARDEMNKAVSDGVAIDLYKIMAFDYGGIALEQTQSVIRVMEQAHQQIKQVRTDLNDQEAYAATGLILMNGHTDQASELYSLDTFKKLIDYANDKQLGRVSFWSLNRDRPCAAGKNEGVSGVCSSISQEAFEFTKLLTSFDADKHQTSVTSETTIVTLPSTKQPSDGTTVENKHKSTDGTTVENKHKSTDVSQTIGTHEVRVSTTPYISTSRVTYSPIIDDVDCRIKPSNAHFPYKNDCSEYIRCYNKLAHLEVCPKGTIYDTKLHLCNWPSAVDRPECK